MRLPRWISSVSLVWLLALPASTNYRMHDYGFGAGGNGVSDSTTYSMTGITGETSAGNLDGSTYDLGPGLQFTRQTNTPAAPTFSNPSSYYNRLTFIIDSGSNPSDTLFAIAISDDSFVTTEYVQADLTVGANPVYRTYAQWGGASGDTVTGLTANTTYSLKVKAIQTEYTESAFSAVATAATLTPSLSYDIDISSTDSESAPPYTLAFGTLNVGSVTTASERIWIDLDTNADQGAFVYVYANTSGLSSTTAGYTITSATQNLASVSEGFGIRAESLTQSNGGPLLASSPYDGSNDSVGVLDTTTHTIVTSSSTPVTAGRASFLVKAKASTSTPSANDYATTITLIASATF